MKKFILSFLWFPITIGTLIFCLGFYCDNQKVMTLNSTKTVNKEEIISFAQMPYKSFSSQPDIPQILGEKTKSEFDVKTSDITPQLIYQYLKTNKSPMLPSYQDLVDAAYGNEIDPLFMVAIAQCESNLGKKMPHQTDNIYECHNPFGWGIHSEGTLCFTTWKEGYETVAQGLREKYFNKGLESTEEIMTIYTPPALEKDGSWAKCVNQFLQELNKMKEKM
ncbi:hypothetical protein GYA19_02045 [Candidatus Beckwithbacteria bacterium]|nr:hypothetical protein [Candidatus Beckwithbacteria bacterium]